MAALTTTDAGGRLAANSEHSLHTVAIPSPNDSVQDLTDRSRLLSPASSHVSQTSYGSTEPASSTSSLSGAARRRILLFSGLRMSGVFILSCLILGGTLWLALPTLDP
jgi:hypothetical protein